MGGLHFDHREGYSKAEIIGKTTSHSSPLGNRRTMITADGAHSYTYDDIYELREASHPFAPLESYTYDGVGNRKSSRDHPDWHYDDNNRLTSHNGTTYTHDDNGNILTKTDATGSTIYEYDSENRLIRITDPEQRVTTYTYDGLGRRIEKDVDGRITRYVYDLEDILFEYDGNNTLTARYTHGPGIDDPIGMEREGQTYFYHTDGLGSITHITDSTKQIVTSYGYDAFGNITSKTGSLTNPYTYTGREYDPESGLYYYRARYYDPKIGRFLQPDPLDMAMVILIRQYFPGSPISGFLYHLSLKNPLVVSSLYTYVGNTPINRIDPFGLQWHKSPAVWLDIGALGADIGAIFFPPLIYAGWGLSVLNTFYAYHQWREGKAAGYDVLVSGITTAVGFFPHPITVYGSDITILIYDIIRAEQAYSKNQGWCTREIEFPRESIEKIIPPGMPMP